MDPRLIAPAQTLRLNTKLFRNCLHGMTGEQAERRPEGFGNNALWVASHMTKARFGLLKRLGAERANPLPRGIVDAKGIDDVTEWPTLDAVRTAWTEASHAIRDRLEGMTAAQLDAPVDVRFPVFEQTTFALIVFMTLHDTYHVGQLSTLRKLVGLPGMSFADP
ncbi:MAG: DinB family protein [Gemmatimonadota bacterium]|nr:DinB family protein [Gemmatimonadota bacterium]